MRRLARVSANAPTAVAFVALLAALCGTAAVVGDSCDNTQRDDFTAVGMNGTITGDVSVTATRGGAFDVADRAGHAFLASS